MIRYKPRKMYVNLRDKKEKNKDRGRPDCLILFIIMANIQKKSD